MNLNTFVLFNSTVGHSVELEQSESLCPAEYRESVESTHSPFAGVCEYITN
ncbi:hypothetical protein NIES4103_47560 [Nostoc sp. NIES-4103]|nr:hypothetical protein NIES4103_47560 [Nostoc sp. NIES-4103]